MVFSQSLNWELTANVMGGLWKRTKIKRRPQKGVSVFQGHRRKRHLLEGLLGNFPNYMLGAAQLEGGSDRLHSGCSKSNMKNLFHCKV
jgi:hypothetical protein